MEKAACVRQRRIEGSKRSKRHWATATRTAAADGRSVVRALSEDSRAASDASATTEWAATTDAKGGVRALSEASNAASKAIATAA